MLHQHFADEDEADALTIRLGREEWSKQFGFRFLVSLFSSLCSLPRKMVLMRPMIMDSFQVNII